MEIRQLKNIVAVAECKSFSQAAVQLNISQPALSVSIKNLEREVGADIFVRARKEVVPTEFGAEFLVYARSVLREIEKAEGLIRGTKTNRTRVIRVGLNSIVSTAIVLGVIPKFAKEYPNVRVEIDVDTGPMSEAFRKISAGLWDFGVVLGYAAAAIPKEFSAKVCAHLTTFPYARKGHPLAKRRKVALSDLAEQRWALSTLTGGEALTSALVKSGLKRPTIVTRVNSFELLMGLVEATDWVTFLPSEIVDRYHGARFTQLFNSELQFRTNVFLLNSNDLEMTLPARMLSGMITSFLRTVG